MVERMEVNERVTARLREIAEELRGMERSCPALPREAAVSLNVSQDALDRAAYAIEEHKISVDGVR